MWPATNLLILRKSCRFEKANHYYFVKDMTHELFFEEKLYKFHFHKNDATWPFRANGPLISFDDKIPSVVPELIMW